MGAAAAVLAAMAGAAGAVTLDAGNGFSYEHRVHGDAGGEGLRAFATLAGVPTEDGLSLEGGWDGTLTLAWGVEGTGPGGPSGSTAGLEAWAPDAVTIRYDSYGGAGVETFDLAGGVLDWAYLGNTWTHGDGRDCADDGRYRDPDDPVLVGADLCRYSVGIGTLAVDPGAASLVLSPHYWGAGSPVIHAITFDATGIEHALADAGAAQSIPATPLPGGLALLPIGLGALAWASRRRTA